jgi:hypothetical protein
VLEPPGAHQVHHQDELTVRRGEQEALRPPPDVERAPVERGERRIDCLQCRDVRRPGVLDRRRGDERIELAAPRLDFG